MFHRHAFHRVVFAVPILVAGLSVAAFAQSPNTSSIAVVVFDQQEMHAAPFRAVVCGMRSVCRETTIKHGCPGRAVFSFCVRT